ncbi:unnamed protein product [Adineta ricciae]|uniref:G-protein coupled receptors family 1 profile domain-containing protein n=1 Tax=Adineta ricciae TaxID=249248 RepID=A0A814FGB5_ADIRI|nr:unnamed protein product [Adineta ricciae]CAF0982970.1 unnamed protein product [Adineta ricciae]
MNVTLLVSSNTEDYHLVALISLIFVLIAVTISAFIFILVWQTKPRLHTINHLLMCNTALATVFYCVTMKVNFAYVLFGQWDTSDLSCRFRAYFAYSGIAGVIYSYLIQAISRFFFSVLSNKYRRLTSFKTHYILIICQWLVVFLVTSPSVLTNDIYFAPNTFCWVPVYRKIHVAYTAFAYYILPVAIIVIIYTYIYVRIRKVRANATAASQNSQKRELELLRRIAILLGIYLTSGIPSLLFMVTSIRLIYMINLVSPSVGVSIEKLCTVLLDREMCQIIRAKMRTVTRVTPFENRMVLTIDDRKQNA